MIMSRDVAGFFSWVFIFLSSWQLVYIKFPHEYGAPEFDSFDVSLPLPLLSLSSFINESTDQVAWYCQLINSSNCYVLLKWVMYTG
jgi:hypothetical protein